MAGRATAPLPPLSFMLLMACLLTGTEARPVLEILTSLIP